VTTLAIRGGTVVSLGATRDLVGSADVLVADGVIAAVGTLDKQQLAGCDEIIDATGKLVLPGFANAHLHSPASLSAGTVDDASHPVFMWLNQADTANRTPREIYVSALVGCTQMLLSGTTAVIDHFPEQNFAEADVAAVVQAYEDSGMRAVVALRIWDGEYDDIFPDPSRISPAALAELRATSPLNPRPLAETMAVVEACIRRFNGRAGRIAIFPGPSNPSRCTDDLLLACQRLAETYDVGIHIHLLETQRQDQLARARYGRSMVAQLDALGLLTERLSCAHCIWMDEDGLQRMARTGAVAVHNPESNLKFGSGLAPLRDMKRLGVQVALGTDGISQNDNLILHDAMHLAAILHRSGDRDRTHWIRAADALRMATLGGAAAMRQRGCFGAIEVGMQADLVLYRQTAPWWQPMNDPVQQMVHGENGSSVDLVMVAGRTLVRDGRVVAYAADAIAGETHGMLPEIRRRNAAMHRIARDLEAVL
jgi:cytosine/adenosine deaminase-related metal-dependent hydrolase